MRKSQTTIRHLRVFGTLALIILVFLTACSTGSDSTSVSPTREAATPTPGASARSVSASAIPTATTPAGSPDTERAALAALYDATGGQDWKINDGWLSDAPLGRWQRVITDENGQVTGLDLGSNRLSGEIPTELGDLSNLKLLFINDNNLTGALPQGLTGLSALESFHFHNNSGLCAPIDEAFQTWLQVIALAIGSSCAPEDSLEDREVLVQLYNALDGENWTNSTNWLTERPIREWHGVTNDASGRVTGLMLEGNELTGEMPAGLGSLSNLKRLEFSNNHLETISKWQVAIGDGTTGVRTQAVAIRCSSTPFCRSVPEQHGTWRAMLESVPQPTGAQDTACAQNRPTSPRRCVGCVADSRVWRRLDDPKDCHTPCPSTGAVGHPR